MNRCEPALPDTTDHRQHDRLLIVRSLDDGLDAAEMSQAERLIQSCQECADLVADLRSVSRAVAQVPAARRTRDFRLSAEQAAATRGSFLTRLLRRLDLPDPRILQPLGGAAVAIGLVLVVLGSGLLSTGLVRAPGSGATIQEGPVTAAGATSDRTETDRPPRTLGGGAAEELTSPDPTIDSEMAPSATDNVTGPDHPAASRGSTSEGATSSGSPKPRVSAPTAPIASPPTDTAALSSSRPTPGAATAADDARARPGGDTGIAALGLLLAGFGALLLLARPIYRRIEGR